jgi:hypothetical protein
MSRTMDEMTDPATPLHKYLNQDNVYVSPTALGLVNTRIIGVVLQTYPNAPSEMILKHFYHGYYV